MLPSTIPTSGMAYYGIQHGSGRIAVLNAITAVNAVTDRTLTESRDWVPYRRSRARDNQH